MSNKVVLVIVLADNCPTCNQFNNTHVPGLKKSVSSLPQVELVIIKLASTGTKIDESRYPGHLNKIVGWYPFVALFDRQSWKEPTDSLQGHVFNGTAVAQGKPPYRWEQKHPQTEGGILGWVEEMTSSDHEDTGEEKKKELDADREKEPVLNVVSSRRKRSLIPTVRINGFSREDGYDVCGLQLTSRVSR